jgi:hypothetical protein
MKASHMAAGALLLLTACAAPLQFDKPGVPPGGGQGDLTDCQVEAVQKVPPNNQVNTIYGGPATTYVDCAAGLCTAQTYGGQDTHYTVDRNSGLRQQVMIQCMKRKGYYLRG